MQNQNTNFTETSWLGINPRVDQTRAENTSFVQQSLSQGITQEEEFPHDIFPFTGQGRTINQNETRNNLKKIYKCPFCKKFFFKATCLGGHIQRTHRQMNKQNTRRSSRLKKESVQKVYD